MAYALLLVYVVILRMIPILLFNCLTCNHLPQVLVVQKIDVKISFIVRYVLNKIAASE
jgi:hypothetical protein